MAKFHITEHGLRVVGATQQDIIEVVTNQAVLEKADDNHMTLTIGGVVVNNRTADTSNADETTVYLDLAMADDASYTVKKVGGDICVTNVMTGKVVAVLHNAKNIVMGRPN